MAAALLRISLAALSATPAFSSCAHGTSIHPRQEDGVEINTFGYIGADGPVNWVSLDPEANSLCAAGTRQSPTDLENDEVETIEGSSVTIEIPDMLDGPTLQNIGTTIEVPAEGGTLTLDDQELAFQQFHFHLPSEHLDNGKSRAMEMHMVFEGDDGQIAVVAAFIENQRAAPRAMAAAAALGDCQNGASSESDQVPRVSRRQITAPVLETVFGVSVGVAEPGSSTRMPGLVMSELVDSITAGQFRKYSGSLTTPPCTENVTWLISSEVLSVSEVGFENVRDVLGFNSRFPQNTLGEPNVLQLALSAVPAQEEDVEPPEGDDVTDPEEEDAADPEEEGVADPEEDSTASEMTGGTASYRPIPAPP